MITRALQNRGLCALIAILPGLISLPRVIGWLTSGAPAPDFTQICGLLTLAFALTGFACIVWGAIRQRRFDRTTSSTG